MGGHSTRAVSGSTLGGHLGRDVQRFRDGGDVARRRSFTAMLVQTQRDAARAQATQVREHARAYRAAERARAAYVRSLAAEEKERKRLYAESRAADAEALNEVHDARLAALESLLQATLGVDDHLDFDKLKQPPRLPAWRFSELERVESAPTVEAFMPATPSGLSKVFGKARFEQAVQAGRAAHAEAVEARRIREQGRVAELERRRSEHVKAVEEAHGQATVQHAEVDAFRQDFDRGDPDAVISYLDLVLQASDYPDGFPQAFKLAYVPESRQAVVEYELPAVDIVPAVKAYKYVKSIDKIDGANLLYLLKEHTGQDAKIVPPDDWIDPHPDGGYPM